MSGHVAPSQTLNVPPRPVGAPTGIQFTNIITPMSLTERENWIYAQVISGNVPNFLRQLLPITVSATINGTPHTATYYAAPDYLAIGSDADYFLEPMTPILAQRLCDRLGCTPPTRKMSNQIWTNASVKLAPQPIPPSADMITVPVFAYHNSLVWTQRMSYTNSYPLGALTAGDKKDVVISTLIYSNLHTGVPSPVVIYGWHYQTGVPIQPLYNGHESTYADYSHGVRLVQNVMTVDGSPNTVTNVLTNPNLAALLSDEGPSEGTTSSGVILLPRYTVAAMAPAIITHPRSQSILPGASAVFTSLAVGDAPLGYLWQSNGISLAGATNASLIISNAQIVNAANYSVLATNPAGSASSRPAWLRIKTNIHPTLFADNFDADSSANWNLFWGAANGIPDYTADWAFDHGAIPYTFNGLTSLIPPAPNSPDGSSRAIRFSANKNDLTAATAAVNIYPKGQTFSNNFALKFDLWINYPGNAGGINSTGSTEFAACGINHTGTEVNWSTTSASASDGIWFSTDGDGGAANDYRAWLGNSSGPPTDLTGTAASGLVASNHSASVFQTLFPTSRFETAGAPGKSWIEVELRQTNNTVIWLLDGTIVAQRTNSSAWRSGKIMLAYMDPFASIGNPPQYGFGLFDNVRVEDLTPTFHFTSAAVLTNGQTQLIFSGVPGQPYNIEASTNFLSWQTIGAVTGAATSVTFTDPAATNFPWRFYRAKQAP
ncbi:MAG: hypothetical protein C5B50_14840 [Verrucomicrobia bacterium]|nr:MAG: hypothetical protein C5B50_14840 [Verrucomicrobiota bacterium]